MAMEESPVFQDIPFNSTAIKLENNEESLLSFDFTDIESKFNSEFKLVHKIF